MKKYDAIVIGVGSMGSSACWWLAKRGFNVLGIEQFSSPHTQGAHAGQSRIIRKAYFEHPDYVPLLNRAYENWYGLEQETGEQVYFKTGLIYHGPAGHPVMTGVKNAAKLHNIEIETRSGEQPPFSLPMGFETVFEPDAGFLRPEMSIALLKQQAIIYGATVQENEKVIEWKKKNGVIEVITDKDVYYAKKLIITAGAWTAKTIPQLPAPLKITRQLVVWLKPKNEKIFSREKFPCWLIADHKRPGALYGFPYLMNEDFGEPRGLKLAWHHAAGETDPDNVNRAIGDAEVQQLVKDVAEYIPVLADMELSAAKTCLYANSPDEDFMVDHLPGYDGDVTIACGFSGHGFKFVSVVGEILADLSMKGTTELPVDFLKLNRFGR